MTRLFVSPKRRPRNATLQLETLEKIIAPTVGIMPKPQIDPIAVTVTFPITFKSQNDVQQNVDQSQKASPYTEVHQTSSADGYGGKATGGDASATTGDATAKATQTTGDTGDAKAQADAQTGDTGNAKASSKKSDPEAESGDSGEAESKAKAYSGDSGYNDATVKAYSGDAKAFGGDAYANGKGGESQNDSLVKNDIQFGSPYVTSQIEPTDQQLEV